MARAPMTVDWRKVERELLTFFESRGVTVTQREGEQYIHVAIMPDGCMLETGCAARLSVSCKVCKENPPSHMVVGGPEFVSLSALARRLAE